MGNWFLLLLSLPLLVFLLLAVALAAVAFAAAREQEMAREIATARFAHRFLVRPLLAEPPDLSLDSARAIATHHTGTSRPSGPSP